MNAKIFLSGYKYKPLKTKRLLLIKPDLKYKEELYKMTKFKELWVYNGGSDSSKTTQRKVTSQINKRIKNWNQKKSASFFIIYDNHLIGSIGMYDVVRDFQSCFIGYILHPKYWNQGFMSEVLSEFIKFTFNDTCISRIAAQVCIKNIGSVKVLEKNHFRREGLLRSSCIYSGKRYDDYVYGLLKKDIAIGKKMK